LGVFKASEYIFLTTARYKNHQQLYAVEKAEEFKIKWHRSTSLKRRHLDLNDSECPERAGTSAESQVPFVTIPAKFNSRSIHCVSQYGANLFNFFVVHNIVEGNQSFYGYVDYKVLKGVDDPNK